MKPLLYLIVYSLLGFLLERLINLAFLGVFYDNRVLYGPYQPMYGLGVVLTLYGYRFIKQFPIRQAFIKFMIIWGVALAATAFSEHLSGTLYEYFTGTVLWDYRMTFPWCQRPYTCLLPTAIFALIAVFTVIFIHPFIEGLLRVTPKIVKWAIIIIFIIDVVLTYKEVLL